ncbi:MAG: energy transducer TonB [Gammaproteobacteria bacterium]|nr:energy transducer TonB [Gammaproteobacteria bacterium]
MTSSTKLAARALEPPDDAPIAVSPRPGATLVVLSRADEFLLEIGLALQGLATVRPVDDLAEALHALREESGPQALAVDAPSLDTALATLEAATLEAPTVPVLLFSPAHLHPELAALTPDPRITVLPTPLEPEPTARAIRRAIESTGVARPVLPEPAAAPRVGVAATPTAFESPTAPAANGGRPRDRSRTAGRWLAVGAALAVIAGGAYRLIEPRSADGRPPVAPAMIARHATAAAPLNRALVQGRLDDLLAKARTAMHEHRYTDPPADNALLYYQSAAAVDPTSAEARDGLHRIGAVLDQRVQGDLTAGHLNQAAAALATIAAILPDHPALAAERLQVASAQQARQNALAAQRQVQANAERLAGLVEARIHSGALDGGADSASAYAAELTAAAPQNPLTASTLADLRAAEAGATARAAAVARAREDAIDAARRLVRAQVAQRLLARARTAALAGQDDARDLLGARTLGADPSAIAAVHALLTSHRLAAARAGAAPALRLVRRVMPRYPHEALDQHVAGSVVVAFVVDPHGRTRDVHVIAESPRGTFDHAATVAVERWRYAPPTLDGKPVSVPARIKIRFAPPR